MRRFVLAAVILARALDASAAAADPGDGGAFRRTTPRASVERDAAGLLLGIPGGRAWGIEGALRPVEPGGPVTVTLAVDDPDVAEAFVRIAYYARADARSRQLATSDSPFVRVGEDRRIVIDLDPPAGAVAYRLRVLGRLSTRPGLSRADAIRVRWSDGPTERGPLRPSLTRLETDRW